MSAGPKTFRQVAHARFARPRRTERDVVAFGVAVAAIVMFVGTGGSVVPQLVAAWRGLAEQPDILLANAMILNIALILLGWRRYNAMAGQLRDTSRSEAEARRLAEIDPLTGCYNRRSSAPAMAELRDRARAEGQRVAVVLVDLDNFKQINDVHGHRWGDAVLAAAAERMGDILPAEALLARMGGDEFACALAYAHGDRERIEHFASLLVEHIARPIAIGSASVEVTLSVGIVGSDAVDDDAAGDDWSAQMMHKADIAMYHAKKQGKNRFYWFEPAMEQELRCRSELEIGIRTGIVAGEFVPFYEQQVDVETGTIVGFEMLARWQSPGLGMVGPDVFIPIAEEIGVIGDLSESLMVQAFRDARGWDPNLSLSVNISPVQMRDPWFAQKLLKLLLQNNFPPSRLDIEITESCLHENIAQVRSLITSLRNQGVSVSLDDFGTGYASLSQLRTLPFDRIKIDRSFIREIKNEEASGKLVDAIVAMGAGLKMPITAEGIEDEAILAVLQTMGSLKGQGYHYGRPESAAAVVDRLRDAKLLSDPSSDPAAIGADIPDDKAVQFAASDTRQKTR